MIQLAPFPQTSTTVDATDTCCRRRRRHRRCDSRLLLSSPTTDQQQQPTLYLKDTTKFATGFGLSYLKSVARSKMHRIERTRPKHVARRSICSLQHIIIDHEHPKAGSPAQSDGDAKRFPLVTI